MKKIQYMDTSFRDGFQSCFGARVKTEDWLPVLESAALAGTTHFEVGGGARFQCLYFYCQECHFEMLDSCRRVVGPDVNLQTVSRGVSAVSMISQSRDIIDLQAKLFKKHGVTTIRNFDALNDIRNLVYSGRKISEYGLKHEATITLMGLPPGLDKEYTHSSRYYVDCLKEILQEKLPFDVICFKDASGTTTPKTVYDTIKEARKLLPEKTLIHFHTHETAGLSVACNMAAIEAGVDIIDLAMSPCSGGIGQCDILTMWHRLKGTDYTLDIDYKKIIDTEELFTRQMDKYFLPPESREVKPIVTFSPLPGGALTTNTQMMRDANCLHLFDDVLKEMKDVVSLGGFATSVTPVAQFYFQQAFANVTQGKWKKITDGYGKMILGYFGKTPVEPDPEVVKTASEQLGLKPTTKDIHDINDMDPRLGIDIQKKILSENNLPITDENIFIVASCGDNQHINKGLEFLKGNLPLSIRYKDEQKKEAKKSSSKTAVKAQEEETYTVTVDGRTYNVHVAPGATTVKPVQPQVPSKDNKGRLNQSGNDIEIKAPMPGNVNKISAPEGSRINKGDTVLIIEAMKMETPLKSPISGTVVEIAVNVGDSVAADDLLAVVEEGA
ncbi:MAG: hypothetical protein K9M56_09690 [Victivallales bacterium]|nr:hypothetical protein [Victivallales bacterium]